VSKLIKKPYVTEDRSLEQYLQEIGKIDLLKPKEEIQLAKRVRAGDDEALKQLAQANLRFVVSVAKQYQNQGLPLSDLINEGNVGLIKAAQAILQALAEQSRIVRLPLNRVGALHKIGKASSELEQEFGREPSADEIADELDMTEHEVMDTLKISSRHLSLDAPFSEGEDNSLLDVLSDGVQPLPDENLMTNALKEDIRRALDTLSKREAKVISLYFGLDGKQALTLEEIGVRFKLTRERVRQIKEKAIRRLRHASRSRLLRTYLH
jgi:RNA polymerase primary sigma factor